MRISVTQVAVGMAAHYVNRLREEASIGEPVVVGQRNQIFAYSLGHPGVEIFYDTYVSGLSKVLDLYVFILHMGEIRNYRFQ
jgi:hypothetical protein